MSIKCSWKHVLTYKLDQNSLFNCQTSWKPRKDNNVSKQHETKHIKHTLTLAIHQFTDMQTLVMSMHYFFHVYTTLRKFRFRGWICMNLFYVYFKLESWHVDTFKVTLRSVTVSLITLSIWFAKHQIFDLTWLFLQ